MKCARPAGSDVALFTHTNDIAFEGWQMKNDRPGHPALDGSIQEQRDAACIYVGDRREGA